MARPIKQGIDYFPLDVVLDDKFELIEAVHGVAGFGVVIKLYQKIYEHGYYIEANERFVLMLSKRINVNINSINAIINDCLRWKIFSQKLYDQYLVLTSKGVQRRYFEVVKRRKEVQVDMRLLLIDHKLPQESIKEVNEDIIPVNADNNGVNTCDGTQSKGKKRESKQKGEEKGAPPPEIISFPDKKLKRSFDKMKTALLMSDHEINATYTMCSDPGRLTEAVQCALEYDADLREKHKTALHNPGGYIRGCYNSGKISGKTRYEKGDNPVPTAKIKDGERSLAELKAAAIYHDDGRIELRK